MVSADLRAVFTELQGTDVVRVTAAKICMGGSDFNVTHLSMLWSRLVSVPLGRLKTSSNKGTSPSPRNHALALPGCKRIVKPSDSALKLSPSYGNV